MPSAQLFFDAKTHTATFNGQILSLHPLSFKLLNALADADGETLSVNRISSLVWAHGSASAETIKQRIFVLRKAISEAGIEGLNVQSIRGEGYRLIIDAEPISAERETDVSNQTITNKQRARIVKNLSSKTVITSIAVVIILALTLIFYTKFSQQIYTNNRVALWTNVESHQLPQSAATLYTLWNEKLMDEMAHNRISLVFSDKQKEVLVPVQARRNRLAVVSYFEVLRKNNKTVVNLSIVEPKTATVLRTNSIKLSNSIATDANINEILTSQVNGIKNLIDSEKLYLTKEHKENPQHAIWQQLKKLANNI